MLKELENSHSEFEGHLGVCHTRLASKGDVSDTNAHPHYDELGKIAVFHSGLISNYDDLKSELKEAGVKIVSDTDTELISHLISL